MISQKEALELIKKGDGRYFLTFYDIIITEDDTVLGVPTVIIDVYNKGQSDHGNAIQTFVFIKETWNGPDQWRLAPDEMAQKHRG